MQTAQAPYSFPVSLLDFVTIVPPVMNFSVPVGPCAAQRAQFAGLVTTAGGRRRGSPKPFLAYARQAGSVTSVEEDAQATATRPCLRASHEVQRAAKKARRRRGRAHRGLRWPGRSRRGWECHPCAAWQVCKCPRRLFVLSRGGSVRTDDEYRCHRGHERTVPVRPRPARRCLCRSPCGSVAFRIWLHSC